MTSPKPKVPLRFAAPVKGTRQEEYFNAFSWEEAEAYCESQGLGEPIEIVETIPWPEKED